MSKRERRILGIVFLGVLSSVGLSADRPNILLVISDDQSWPHAGAYGDKSVETPAFDRIAEQGALFTHGFCPASQCSPSRAALLTGRNIWQLEEAGTHASTFPKKFMVYTEILEGSGYHVGYTGKPWAPGSWEDSGRTRNPAGIAYNEKTLTPPSKYISRTDYAGNFRDFLEKRPEGAPFHFWLGCREPHRNYDPDSGLRAGKKLADVEIPDYWPQVDTVGADFLDYKLEIDWFDSQLVQCLAILEENGELENTLIIVTSDNGMPFPRAKANVYDAGTRVPLAIQWPGRFSGNRRVDDMVSLIDLAPTILEAAGLEPLTAMTGKSLMSILDSGASGIIDKERSYVLLGKERHNYARPDNLGYPIRAIRTRDYLYIQNLKPDRWPLGDPPYYLCHTKMSNPTKDLILKRGSEDVDERFYEITYQKRPNEELYYVAEDAACMHNLATNPEYDETLRSLADQLSRHLVGQEDPRSIGYGDVFEGYPYYQRLPESGFPGFMEYGKYNPAFVDSDVGRSDSED